ncbi:MAG: hypothetical protein IJA88_00195 [Clostridia bacterium]|nr:hypothetical protein [Clostridia bacterium]
MEKNKNQVEVKIKHKFVIDAEWLTDYSRAILDEWSDGRAKDFKWNVRELAKVAIINYFKSPDFYEHLSAEIERLYEEEKEQLGVDYIED